MDENCILNVINEAVEEGKIVTYRWLSHYVSIHTNVAKQYLYKYGEEHKGSIFTIYFVSGAVSDEGEEKVVMQVVPEEDLTDVKASYSSLFGVHVYSIQKTRVMEPSLLYTVDSNIYNGFPLHEYSALRSGKALLRVNKAAKVKVQKAERELKEENKPRAKAAALSFEEKKSATSDKEETSSVRRSPRKHGHSIRAADCAKKSPSEQTGNDNKAKSQSSVKSSAKSSLGAMFAKQSEKQKEKAKAGPVETKPEDVNSQKSEKQPDDTSNRPKARKSAKSKANNQSRQKPTQKRQKDHQVSSEEESVDSKDGGSGRPQKKRQRKVRHRVMRADFSSSDEDQDHSDDDDGEEAKTSAAGVGVGGLALESPPDSPQAPPPEENTAPAARNKRKVAHKKTFLDDDGFMVTETVMESESGSETEETAKSETIGDKNSTKSSPKEKEQKKETPPKKISAHKGGKQASLTSFFKKK